MGNFRRVAVRLSVAVCLVLTSGVVMATGQSFLVAGPAEAQSLDPAFQSLIGTQAIGNGSKSYGIKTAVKIGNEIYFGGDFRMVNGSSSYMYLARYDLTTNLVSEVPGWLNKGVVHALTTVTDANGTFLIVGGVFNDAATTSGDYLVKYKVGSSPATWTPFLQNGSAVMPSSNSGVYALHWESSNSTLYVGGNLGAFSGVTGAKYLVAVTNVTSASSVWTAMGTPVCTSNGIRSVTVSTGHVYAAGDCSVVGKTPSNVPLPYVARRNLTTGEWDSVTTTVLASSPASTTNVGLRLANGGSTAFPTAVHVDASTSTVYVGGNFAYIGTSTTTGAQPLNGLMWASSNPAAKSEWKQVVTGSSVGLYPLGVDTVRSFSSTPDGVVVSGSFTQLGGTGLGLSAGATTAVTSFARMSRIQGTGNNSRNLATYAGGTGNTVWLDSTASGVIGPVDVTIGGTPTSFMIPFGNFTNGGLIGANDAAALWRADGSGWNSFGATSPLNGAVYATAVTADNRYVYAGGDFTNLGGTASANYLAVYDRQLQSWSVPAWWYPSSTASRFRIRALRISGDFLYIAGVSEVSGATSRGNYVYRASAINPTVNSPALAAVAGTRIDVRSGVTNEIRALEFDQSGRLVVGGIFTKIAEGGNCAVTPLDSMKSLFRVVLAGTESCEKFRSDGAAPVGNGTVNSIVAANVDGLPVLLVGGSFGDLSGNSSIDNVAMWDDAAGSNGMGDWLDLGTNGGQGPLQGEVSTLVAHGNRLYVGGTFSNAGGDADADNLAAVDMVSKSWSDLGITPNASVYSMTQVGVTLYVGGAFTGSNVIQNVKALFQVALAPFTESPSSSLASFVGRTGGSIVSGTIYSMSKKRVGSGSNADNFIYVGGTFTDLGSDPSADAIGLVRPTFNEISNDPVSDVGLDVGSVEMKVTATAGSGIVTTNDTPNICSWASNVISLERVGTCQVSFAHSGGGGFAAAPSTSISFEVLKVDDVINFPALSDRPYSSVAFDPGITSISRRTASLTVSAGSAGVCSITSGAVQMISAGDCTVTASLSGNTDWNAAADVTRTFAISSSPQTITFINPGEQENGSQLTLSATASSGLQVTYNSSTIGVCTVSGSSLSLVGGGSCTVTASQAGDSRFAAATNVVQSFYVWPGSRHDLVWNTWEFPSQAMTVGASATVRALAQKVADGSVTTEVDWQVDTPTVCSLSSSLGSGRRTLSALSVGTCTLTMSRTGDASFRSLAPRSVAISIDAAPTTTTPTSGTSAGSTTINNTYVVKKTGGKYKAVIVPVRPRQSGEVIMTLKSSPRTVCTVGNFGTSKKPVWKAVMLKPGVCSISMSIKKKTGKLYRSSMRVVVRSS